jgi:hypothetical protein
VSRSAQAKLTKIILWLHLSNRIIILRARLSVYFLNQPSPTN